MIDLSLRPAGINKYPIGGILIPGSAPVDWVREIRRMGFLLERVTAYPVSGVAPNSVWGCLLECDLGKDLPDLGRNTLCQFAHKRVFLPEKSDLFPGVSMDELDRLLLGKKHFFHPELGMVELPPPVRWEELIAPPFERTTSVRTPAPGVFIPKQVRGFQIFAPRPEEILDQLEERHFPERRKLENKPLNVVEKIKLALYKTFLPGKLPDAVKDSALLHDMQADFEDLIERNKKQIDRLVDMLKSNPMEGLKYAIPVDENGTGRGNRPSGILLSRLWHRFSIFESPRQGGGRSASAVIDSDDMHRLKNQYYETANKLMNKEDFRKAAFIYLKLLKDTRAAALALGKAGLWAEAASIYLKYLHDKLKAAEAYEKAKMTKEAIELYQEIQQLEKAGDLYRSIGRQEEANELYDIVVDEYKEKGQYLKASLILRDKMARLDDAQNLLFRGWQENRDPMNCLQNYFDNIIDDDEFLHKLQDIYANFTNEHNWTPLFQVLTLEFKRRPGLAVAIRDIAHEIIAEKRAGAPWVVSELPHYQSDDPLVAKDLMRFKAKRKN